jgi:hypothetical protein
MKLLDVVKDNKVIFDYLRAGYAYYKVKVDSEYYRFPVPLDDIGEATLLNEDKALIFMRYIRKALDNNEFCKII